MVWFPSVNSQATFSWLQGIASAIASDKKGIIDSLFGLYDSYTTETQTGFIRVEGVLLQLINEDGIVADGSSCDTIGKCDPVISAYVD